jgi:paraquat-inducible protein A
MSAMKLGMTSCHGCQLLIKLSPQHGDTRASCPRCGATVHLRKFNSLARTWAFLTAAIILYVPANVLPISVITALGSTQGDTIMSGVIYFIHSGDWPIALVIFTASIFVPILKLMVIMLLLLSVHFRSRWRPRERTRLYRIIEGIGRWSMVDIYVITIMAALVHIGAIANFSVGPAAVYFASVVVLTIMASMSFDPRLIWDAME